MDKKKSKGLFRVFFAPKQSSNCCHIEFEEIVENKTSNEEINQHSADNKESDIPEKER